MENQKRLYGREAAWDGLQSIDKTLAGGGRVLSHRALSPGISHTHSFRDQEPKLRSLANFLWLHPSWSKENYVFAFFMSKDLKHRLCIVVLGRGREGREKQRVRCPRNVTNSGKDQGLSSPRFHSEICGWPRECHSGCILTQSNTQWLLPALSWVRPQQTENLNWQNTFSL